MTGVSLLPYSVVRPDYFSYVSVTSRNGSKISIAYNNSDETFIVSSSYIVFFVDRVDIILPEYIFLYFNRPEFDRYSRFHSWGSAREVFSWDDMCDIEIELPSLPAPRKYVSVYKAILANKLTHESNLDDLKLTCDAYIEKLRRENTLVAIVDYIKESDKRNTELKYKVDSVKGITTEKQFIETKANMEDVKLDAYKIVNPKQFAYVSDTSRRGDKISLAYNDSEYTYLVSSISTVFSVNGLLPEYLFLFFHRDEFNRYTRFHSWGSAREVFSWDDMCNVKIPIPKIAVQQAIVNILNVYNERKAMVEKLKEQMKNVCPILVKRAVEE
jgi:type I restriction enzyme S subunit